MDKNCACLSYYLARQRDWSRKTFGPGYRSKAITNHIRKELEEVDADPSDLEEWIDVIILAMDGYWRRGGRPIELMKRLQEKQDKNLARKWPPPAPEQQTEPVEHIREQIMEEKKPLAGLWRENPDTPEGKYLVQRRDGTVVEWPNFVIGAKDPAAPAALLEYAKKAEELGMNMGYVQGVVRLAHSFTEYRLAHGEGDPDRGRHRTDDPATIAKMRTGGSA